jgi:hypothetical protein
MVHPQNPQTGPNFVGWPCFLPDHFQHRGSVQISGWCKEFAVRKKNELLKLQELLGIL